MHASAFDVELDVFSGRANPTWRLSADEAAELSARVERLTAGGEPVREGALGYRGFQVYRRDGEPPVLWMKVFAGTVRIEVGNQPQCYVDTAGIEQWLRDQAVARGLGALVAGG